MPHYFDTMDSLRDAASSSMQFPCLSSVANTDEIICSFTTQTLVLH